MARAMPWWMSTRPRVRNGRVARKRSPRAKLPKFSNTRFRSSPTPVGHTHGPLMSSDEVSAGSDQLQIQKVSPPRAPETHTMASVHVTMPTMKFTTMPCSRYSQ
jgi:hypothetical protein